MCPYCRICGISRRTTNPYVSLGLVYEKIAKKLKRSSTNSFAIPARAVVERLFSRRPSNVNIISLSRPQFLLAAGAFKLEKFAGPGGILDCAVIVTNGYHFKVFVTLYCQGLIQWLFPETLTIDLNQWYRQVNPCHTDLFAYWALQGGF